MDTLPVLTDNDYCSLQFERPAENELMSAQVSQVALETTITIFGTWKMVHAIDRTAAVIYI
jgi:hypothetical protein